MNNAKRSGRFGQPSQLLPNRLTPTNAKNWDYDAVGNWDSVTTNSTTQTRGANRQNEITSVSGTTTPTYDSNGNLTKDENDNRFVYDAWNMMVQVKNSSNVVIVTYGRDALHRHVTDTVGASVTDRFFSQDWQVLETKVGSNTITRNVWSPAYVDALVLRDRDTDSNGTLDERLYSLQDANWNTTGLVNTSGTIVERNTYSPFGVVTFRDVSGASLGASAKDWLFLHQGGQTDSIGNYDFRNRIYSPTLGRWLTNDPLGFAAGDVNTYRYLKNNAGQFNDPTGLTPVPGASRPPSSWPDLTDDGWKWDKGSGRFKKGGRFRHWDRTPGHVPHWDDEDKYGNDHKNIYLEPGTKFGPTNNPDPVPKMGTDPNTINPNPISPPQQGNWWLGEGSARTGVIIIGIGMIGIGVWVTSPIWAPVAATTGVAIIGGSYLFGGAATAGVLILQALPGPPSGISDLT